MNAQDSLQKLPKRIHIETTNCCNIKCRMCPHGHGLIREKGFIDIDLFKRIIDQVTEIENYHPAIGLHINGEPLLHKQLETMIRYAADRGLYTFFHTNGMLLDARRARSVIEAGLSEISFSFEGEDPQHYESIRVGADCETVRKNIRHFLTVCGDTRVIVEVLKFRDRDESLKIDPDFKSQFPGADFHSFFASDWHGSLDVPGTSEKDIRSGAPQVCGDLQKVLVVGWDGRVHTCCIDYNNEQIIGDLRCEQFLDVWNGPARRRYAQMICDNQMKALPLCKNCSAPYTVSTKKRNLEVSRNIQESV